jgi:uncharacterized protein (DUF2267 family)
MATTGVEVFDTSVHTSNQWLDALGSRLGSDDRWYAFRVLRAYLQVLRDGLTVDDAARLAAYLPHPLRGLFYEGWDPGATPRTALDQATFLARIAGGARLPDPTDAALAARSATEVLRERCIGGSPHLADLHTDYSDAAAAILRESITGADVDDLLRTLPAPVRTLLLPAERA